MSGPPLHIHRHHDEWLYVVEGEYLFQIGEKYYELKAGDIIFLPRNVMPIRSIIRKSKSDCELSAFRKMEAFFATTDKWATPPSKEIIAKTFSDHDMIVVGPPLKV